MQGPTQLRIDDAVDYCNTLGYPHPFMSAFIALSISDSLGLMLGR
jgi:hypothetical protein